MQIDNQTEFPMESKQVLLETQNLDIGYVRRREHLLYENLNLSLHKGSLNCLMGPNGAGKSTLLKTLTGLIKPLKGEIGYLGDKQLLQKPMIRAKTFSVVLTGSPQLGLLRVKELVALGRHPYTGWAGVYSQKDLERVAWALKVVNADYLGDRMVHTLSDGERQRVMVARALAQDTPLVFLDEPTAFLDLPHKIELMHIFRKLTHECGLTLLMSTHDLELSLQYADNLWLLGQDRQCVCGSPEDLLLEGSLERVFGNAELDFDREKGVFSAKSEYRYSIHLNGDPIAMKWTRNALEKLGIGVCESGPDVLEIEVRKNGSECSFQWVMTVNGECVIYHSISELVKFLKHKI